MSYVYSQEHAHRVATSERRLLGACLLDLSQVVAAGVTPEHWLHPAHAKIWGALQALAAEQFIGDAAFEVERRTGCKAADLMSHGAAADVESAAHYGDVIREAAASRAARLVLERASVSELMGPELIAETVRELLAIDADRPTMGQPFGDLLREVYDGIEAQHASGVEITGLVTGFGPVDRALLGLPRGEGHVVVAARPSEGKSALALTLARYAARRGVVVDWYQLEGRRQTTVKRLLAQDAQVDANNIRRARFELTEWGQMSQASERLSRTSLQIYDRLPRYASALVGQVVRNAARRGTALVVVDYFQLLRDGKQSKSRSRTDELAEISQALLRAARDGNFTLILAAQLKRESEGRPPRLSDVRDSGCLEQDADIMLALEHPELRDREGDLPVALVHVVKNRDGQRGFPIPLGWNPKQTAFYSLAELELDRYREASAKRRKRAA